MLILQESSGSRSVSDCEEDSLEIVLNSCVLKAAIKEEDESEWRSV